ncbi:MULTISPECIES: hypothetical protein [Bradyrhizobium]|uniref:hypothetical protein n=1 Tax=Bradyrhizobium TaxID=374 RepID=UPI00115FE085|nr:MULTISPECIES: hypothetical protein [Bradyrhizobium]
MSDRITSELLFALNNSIEIKENDWNSIEDVLRRRVVPTASRPSSDVVVPENRFAATVSSGMAKLRSAR